MDPKQTSDEIDLGQVFKKIGDGIRGSWLGFMWFLAVLRRIPLENRYSFLGIIVTSILLAIGYNFLLRKSYYESTMILSSEYLNKRLVDNTIDKLELLAEEQSKGGLARLFNVTDSLANNIVGFEAKPFVAEADVVELEILKQQLQSVELDNPQVIDQVISRIEIENRHSFEITIRTLKPSAIVNMQNALVGYFRNNDYVKHRIEISRINLLERKNKLISDLQKMDSLKTVIYANYKSMSEQARSGSNNVILSDRAVTNPVEVYAQDQKLYDELQSVERQLYLQPDFEIVDSFTAYSEPAGPGTALMILYALLMGIAVAYLDVALRRFNNYLANIK